MSAPNLLRPRKVSLLLLLFSPSQIPTESRCAHQALHRASHTVQSGCILLVTWQVAEHLQLACRYQMLLTAWTDTCCCCGQSSASASARTSAYSASTATAPRYVSALHTSAKDATFV